MTFPEQALPEPFRSRANQPPAANEYKALLELVAQAIWETDPTGNVIIDSPSWRAYTGQTLEQWLDQGWVPAVHPDDRADALRQWQEALQQQTPFNANARLCSPNENWQWTNLRATPILGPDRRVQKWVGMTINISDRQKAQASLLQEQERNAFLLTLSDVLRPLTDPVAIQYQAACVLGQFLGAHRVGYVQTLEDRERVVVTSHFTQGASLIEGVYRLVDYGPDLLESMQAGRTVVWPDIVNDLTLTQDQKSAYASLQVGASLNIPLIKQKGVVGILFVHYQQAHGFSPQQVELAQETAKRTWEAIERAKAEEVLRQREDRFRLLVDKVPQAIWVTDPEGNAEFLNQWWTLYSGIPFQATTAWQIAADILHPQDGPVVAAAFRQAMQTGTGFEVEQRNRSASGEYRWFLNKAEPYRDPKSGQITQWVGTGVDIHDRKLAQQQLQESEARYRDLSVQLEEKVQQRTQELNASNQEYAAINQELQEANSLLKRSNENLQTFAYIASHDLQEPLRKIQSFGDILKDQYGPSLGNGVTFLERMQLAASRMSALIKDLLSFSRISTQRDTSGPVSLRVIVEQVLATLELTIQDTGAQVEVAPLPVVSGDGLQLGQLFQNLLSNALKFRRPGVIPQITVRSTILPAIALPAWVKTARPANAYHQLEVTDNGIGFDEKYVERIFQVFQRLHGKSEFSGTGIGLSICEKVVINHGGAITASSQPGKGATFWVYLPFESFT